MPLLEENTKFEDFNRRHWDAQFKAGEMRSRADHSPTQENLDSAKVAVDAQAALCREFRNWCIQKRDGIARMLDDPTLEFSDTDRARWKELHSEIGTRLPALEAECPPGERNDPQSSPPDGGPARLSWQ